MKSRYFGFSLTLLEAVIYVIIGVILDSRTDPADQIIVQVYVVLSIVLVINRLVSSFDLKAEIDSDIEPLRIDVAEHQVVLKQMTVQLENLGDVLDLTGSGGVGDVRAIQQSYASITNLKLQEVKDRIVRDASEDLRRLQHERRTPILDEPDFYKWLFAEFQEADSSTTIKIVSMDEELEWTNTHEEKEFWRHNREAAERGANIQRVFLFDSSRLDDASKNPAIFGHSVQSEEKVAGFVVDKRRFAKNSPTAVTEAGQGFIVIDDELAIVDVFSPDGQARGFVTFSRSDVTNYLSLFEKFSAVARPLDFRELGE